MGGGASGALPGHADFKMPMRYSSAEVKLTLEYLRMEFLRKVLTGAYVQESPAQTC